MHSWKRPEICIVATTKRKGRWRLDAETQASWKMSFLFIASKAVDSEDNKTSDDNSCCVLAFFLFCFCFYLQSPFFRIAFRAENMVTWLSDRWDDWIDAFLRLHNGNIQQQARDSKHFWKSKYLRTFLYLDGLDSHTLNVTTKRLKGWQRITN